MTADGMTGTGLTLEKASSRLDLLPQFFGVSPVKRVEGGEKRELCRWRVCYSGVLFLSLLSYLGLRLVYNPASAASYEWKIVVMKTLANCGSALVILITAVVCNHHMGSALATLKSSGIGVMAYSSKLFLSFFFIVFILIMIALDLVTNDLIACLSDAWGFYLATLITNACVDQFVGKISILKDAFTELHHQILTKRPRLDEAISSFEKVTTAAEIYNEAYGTQLLVIVGAHFLLSTVDAFLIVSERDLVKRLLLVSWCGISAAFPLRIVYAIDHLLQQRNEFNSTLNSLIVKGHIFSSTSESAKVKLHVAMKKELEFTARGFFSLDYGLINSMLGAVTTYLVILMQFDQ